MYVIMVYDIGVERVLKVLKISRKYLTHVQNSVLEGEMTAPTFRELKKELKSVIDKDYDRIVFYQLQLPKHLRKESLGASSNSPLEYI